LLGEKVYSSPITDYRSSSFIININGISDGMYIMKIMTENGVIEKKFIKE